MSTYNHSSLSSKKYLIDLYNPIHFIKRILVKGAIKKIDKRNLAIADIGCGVGVLCQELGKFGKVIGYDKGIDSIKIAKSVNKKNNVSFEKSDVFKVKGKEKFDIIVMTEVLEYIKDDAKALKKIYGLLKKNGHLILTVPINEKFRTEIDIRENFIRYTKKDLIKKLEKSGFEIIKTRYWGFPLINLFYLYIYIPASNKKADRKDSSRSVLLTTPLLKIFRYLFLIDLLFDNPDSFDLFAVAKKI